MKAERQAFHMHHRFQSWRAAHHRQERNFGVISAKEFPQLVISSQAYTPYQACLRSTRILNDRVTNVTHHFFFCLCSGQFWRWSCVRALRESLLFALFASDAAVQATAAGFDHVGAVGQVHRSQATVSAALHTAPRLGQLHDLATVDVLSS